MTDWHDVQSSAPVRPSDDPGPAPSRVAHRPWSTILLGVHYVAVALGALAVIVGMVVGIPNMGAPPSEAWGAAIGLLLVFAGLLLGVPAAGLIKLTVNGRRHADDGRPRTLLTVGLIVVALTGLGVAAALFIDLPIALPFLALYALPAVFLIRATQTPAA